jgi:hypothetical protein
MKKVAFTIFVVFILSGCVKKTEWPISEKTLNLIVVDGIITDESKSQTIRITLPVKQLNSPPLPVTGADVLISNEDSTWQLTENPVNSGLYLTEPTFHTQSGKTYTLLIYLDDQIYSAKAYMSPGTVFKELQYVKNEDNDLFHIDWVASAFSSMDPAMWEVLLDWSKVPGYENSDSASCHARMLFYTLPTLDVSEIFAPEMEQVSFPAGTIINERRYSVTPEHAEFLRELLLETNWTGGMFSLANANVMTNLSSGAIGYFGACSVTSLSITVEP